MKGIDRILIALMCVLLFSISVFAAETTTYHLDDVNISIDIPDDYIVFTRSSSADDPNFAFYGITKDDLDALFEERSIYLNAWDKGVNFEILVTMTDSSFEDFNLVSDTTLSALNSFISESFESRGAECIKSDVYQHSQAKFLRAYYCQVENDNTVYALQYFTSYDGKAICIALRSTSGEIDASENNILNAIVDSVRFDVDPIKPDEPDHTTAFQYHDNDTGISFTVPEDWRQEEFNEERKFLTAKFSSNLEAGLYIIYSGYDYWDYLPSYEKTGMTRKDLDMSELTMQDFASLFDISLTDVTLESYNGKEFYRAVSTSDDNSLGISIQTTNLMRIENGYLVWFQFNGTESSPYYKDLESLVSSVVFPGAETITSQVEPEPETTDAPSTPEDTPAVNAEAISQEVSTNNSSKKGPVKGWVLVPILAVFAVITGIVIKKKRNEHVHEDILNPATDEITENKQDLSDQSMTEATADIQTPVIPRKIQFCRRCGNKLVEGSKFCNNCGTKIEDEDSE